jgi:hypothetical protein
VIIERPALERRVLASLEAGRIPVVLGGCGSGRSSLLLRIERDLGRERSQFFDLSAAATTPERCLAAMLDASHAPGKPATPSADSPRAAFDALLAWFDAAGKGGAPWTFLLDEFLDFRTFESFPGLRHVLRDLVARLADSPAHFVIASRFTTRVHRLLRDAPARFEVMHVPPLDQAEVTSLALLFDGGRREWAADIAPSVAALADGRAGAVALLLDALTSLGPGIDPVAAMAALFAPEGRLTARCRESCELRLQRARGYGALKAILGILADSEPQNLTEIAHHLKRTPGSTKDYLSWLEDVDLIAAHGKRYRVEDPLVRVYLRLFGRAVLPTDDDVVREIGAYAKARVPEMRGVPAPSRAAASAAAAPVTARADAAGDGRTSGIIEID